MTAASAGPLPARAIDADPGAPARFVAAFARAERVIEDRRGIPVVVTDVPSPFTGDLDGAERIGRMRPDSRASDVITFASKPHG